MIEYGLLGEKLGHSFSPQLHKALAGYDYGLLPTPPGQVEDLFRRREFKGLNVTIPYKRTVIPLCDQVDPRAAAIGAVNTVVNRDGTLTGCNTDIDGLIYLARRAGVDMAGEKAQEYTLEQIHHFEYVAEELHRRGFHGFKCHLQGSYGILNYSELCFDYARAGIALYGILSGKSDQVNAAVELKPVLSLKARVESVKMLYQGESAGYGLTYSAERDRRIGILSIGYADGVPRNLSNRGLVLCNGKIAPVIGRICMDQMLVDLSGAGSVKAGDEAVLIGKSGELEIRAEDMAQWAGTISNEILSRMGERLERVAVN